jgi:SnoaL-like domain
LTRDVVRPARQVWGANAAIAFGARTDAAVAANDDDGMDALVAEGAVTIDHKTGRTFGREERLARFRALLAAARDPLARHEPLAALGDSLALLRRTLSASGFDDRALGSDAYRIEELCMVEADPHERCVRAELFGADRLDDAVVRLYERYAEQLPEGRARTRASAIARSVAVVLGSTDPDRLRPVLALDVTYADHRALGWGPAHGVVAFVRALRTLRTALPDPQTQTIDVIAARADALLVRRTVTGEISGNGDRYRRRPIVLWRFGADGRVTQWEQFDDDQREEAVARFDELAAPLPPARLFETSATAAVDRSQEVLATRGERLVLIGQTDSLLVVELNEHGDRVAAVRFGPGDRAAAHAELDARYAAGEATAHPAMWAALWDVRRALAAHDWDRLARLVSASLVAEDHRPLGWGVSQSAEQYAAAIRPLTELRSDVVLRLDHHLLRDRAALFVASWTGSGPDGAFEIPVMIVFHLGRDNRIDRVDHYNVEQIRAARAKLDELAVESSSPPAATEAASAHLARTSDAFCDAFARRDWDVLAALMAKDVVVDDHRLIGWERVRGARDYVQTLHSLVDLAPDAQLHLDHVETATRGLLWIGAWVGTREGGAFEMPWITVSEHDGRGIVLRIDQYDLGQLPEARARFAELGTES